jgi:hypothetical protein
MISVLVSLVASFGSWLRSRAALQLELLALRHPLPVLNRSRPRRLQLATADRCLWAWLSRSWAAWRTALVIVKPETVITWHRRGARLFWTWNSRRRIGRPTVPAQVRALIRTMSEANPLWGAPRIHGELLKLGHRRVSGHRREVHRSSSPTAVTDVVGNDDAGDGHPLWSRHPLTMAERVRRAVDRIYSPRMPRPCHRLE